MSDRKKQDLPRGFSRRRLNRLGMEIPINLERILLGAARDEAFREDLFEDPSRAAADGGFDLTATEIAMLTAMDRSTLEAMIGGFGTERVRRGRFARHVAAAVAGTMVISVGSGCYSAGTLPEPPEDSRTEADVRVDLVGPSDGISADFPDLADANDPIDEDDEDPGEDEADDAEEESDG
ncbi:MAG: hypothetical protein JRG91_04310 [Deltaproteobacteria bacterium]|nr:hypothetical protein [Deltaproteobacteria bacterium]